MNSKVTIVRIIASALIGLAHAIGATVLIYQGHTVPNAYFGVAALAIGGVVGVEVVKAIYHKATNTE